jgi:uncharacterized protein (TIGR00290 family)
MSRQRALVFWSGGKDSALALDRVRRMGDLDVVALVTTLDPRLGRVAMHGVRIELVEAQAQALGLPLVRMEVPVGRDYVATLRALLAAQKAEGVDMVVFGDIFLEDLRAWREELLAEAGLGGVFPLWGADTRALASEFVARGFKAVVCCAEDPALDAGAVGRELDEAFFRDLPAAADPCGENGEYHSFVYDGPGLARPVAFRKGGAVYRALGGPEPAEDEPQIAVPAAPGGTRTRGFWFVDLTPMSALTGAMA